MAVCIHVTIHGSAHAMQTRSIHTRECKHAPYSGAACSQCCNLVFFYHDQIDITLAGSDIFLQHMGGGEKEVRGKVRDMERGRAKAEVRG